MRARRATRTMAALGALAILSGLAGCTPADRPLNALRYADGQISMLIEPCDDSSFRSISVYSQEASPSRAWRISWDSQALVGEAKPSAEMPGEVRLLGEVPGWTVSEDSLTAFAPDVEYSAAMYGSGYHAIPIRFTVADLAAMTPGQVLIGGHRGERKAVADASFRKRAKDAC